MSLMLTSAGLPVLAGGLPVSGNAVSLPPPVSGDFSLMTFANPTAPARQEVEQLARERWHTRPDWWIAGTTPKNLNDDVADLPAGVSYDSGANELTISGNVTLLDGWDFALTGTIVQFNSGLTIDQISNCTFASPAITKEDRVDYVDGSASTAIWEFGSDSTTVIERAFRVWFKAAPGHLGGPFTRTATINHGNTNGSDWVYINTMEYCSFDGYGQDCIKGAIGGVRRYSFFDVAFNVPDDAAQWQSGQTYNRGDIVWDSESNFFLKLCRNNGVTSQPNFSSVGASTSDWEALDPHSDHDQAGQSPPSGTEAYGNFYGRDVTKRRHASRASARGITSVFRRNGFGSFTRQGNLNVHHNIMPIETELNFGGSRPISVSPEDLHPGSTITITDNDFASNSDEITDASGSAVTVANNTPDYDYWDPATLSGISASFSGGSLTYGFTASLGGWATVVLSTSATAMTAKQIIDAAVGTGGVLAKFEVDAPTNSAVSRDHSVSLSSGTYYVHMLYQAGGGIDTIPTVETINV